MTLAALDVVLRAYLRDDASAGLAVLRELSVVARVQDGAIVCDLRTVDPRDDPHLAKALLAIAP
jgi:hypothetical protein